MTDQDSVRKEILENPVIKAILSQLKADLPTTLFYHNYDHTVDVLNEALFFGAEGGLSNRELLLLGTAAAFHDTGFLTENKGEEKFSKIIAKRELEKAADFTSGEIKLILQMIMDTKISMNLASNITNATTQLSGYLIDADVSNFGREDFFAKSQLIIKEKNIQDLNSFNENLLLMLKKHAWHTKAAFDLRQGQKEKNINELERKRLAC